MNIIKKQIKENYAIFYLQRMKNVIWINGLTSAIYLPLLYETYLLHIRIEINKMMNRRRVKGEPYNKRWSNILQWRNTIFLISETAVLNLDTMDVLYAL